MKAAAHPVYRFDRFAVDLQRGVLLAEGEERPLRAKSFAMLRLFVENSGRLVDRDEIMAAVWPGLFVTDDSIAQCVRDIRRALGDSEHRLLRTIKRRGYRFIAPVVTELEKALVESPPQVDARAAAPIRGNDAEHRQITAMSCGLMGFSERANGVDLETLREAVAAVQHVIAEIVARYDGFIVNRQGNTLLVLFGYPAAHENNAEQAVRAGMELCTAVGAAGLGPESTGCRVGVATGMAIIGNRAGEELSPQEIVGSPPILAARLQLLAQPNAVVIDGATRRLVGNLFDCRDLGATEATRDTKPLPHWQVLGARVGESRFESLRGPTLSPLTGRGEEIELLLRRWRRARMGDGQAVLISGEPGIGKSRLTAELERVLDEPYTRLRYLCSPYHRDSALYPFADQFARASRFAPHDPPAARLEKLEGLLAHAAPAPEDVALIADLLSLPNLERHPLPNLSPHRKKERLLEALIRQLEGLARRRPVLIVFEDAHWSDPTSRELLDLTIERMRNLPVLLIVTFRPEFQSVWTGQPQVTTIALNRLDWRDRSTLITQIAGLGRLPGEVVDELVDRSDGVPLFIEELTKSVLESGAPLAIPTTLRDSLMARLDRLGSVRQVAQIGASIGRQFSYSLMRAVSDLSENELCAALDRLVASELVFQRGAPPEAGYAFKHALVQDVAHGSLLRSTRQKLHARIAEALAIHSPELTDTQPELFAQHYAEAGLIEKSVVWWGKAGQRSAERLSLAEAVTQFQKGIDQLALLPKTPAHQRQELEFRVALGAALRVIRGFAAPETGRAFARARELWEQLDYPSEFFHVPVGQANYHALGGELDLAQRLNEELLLVSRERNDLIGTLLAHTSLAQTLMFRGRFASSRSHFEKGLGLHNPLARRSLVEWAARVGRAQGILTQVSGRGNLAIVLFCLGYPDQALSEIKAIITEAQKLSHPPYLVLTHVFSAILLSLVGDNAALGQQADDLAAGAIEHGFPLYRAQGAIFRGWAMVQHGNISEGISLLRSGSIAYRATGSEVWMPQYRALLAMATELAEQREDASAMLDDALHTIERTGERWFEAELNRYKAELQLRLGKTEVAEEFFCKALRISREQQARTWELRASIGLARLRRCQGRHADIRPILAPIYGWFTEGFDTPDLRKAKAMLDELA